MESPEPLLGADELVGLLADDDRRRVVAALVLGADHLDSVRAATGLDARAATRALTRLIDSGLVERDELGGLVLLGAAFRIAARAAATSTPDHDSANEHAAASREEQKVLRTFVRDGRITQIPMQQSKRLVVLDWLAQRFEPGRRYREPMVNLIIGQVHPDTAAWRRYLVDHGLLSREGGEYWRSGGPVDVAGDLRAPDP